ncbi:MAG: maltokinase N-terminal cap-like domain-containing protein [Nocardioidaceae bacterium]
MSAPCSDDLLGYLRDQRWFAGKGGTSEVRRLSVLPWLRAAAADGPRVRVELVTVETEGSSLTYSLPLAYYRQPREESAADLVRVVDDPTEGQLFGYDALRDTAAVAALLHGFTGEPSGGGLEHTVTGPLDLPRDVASRPLLGEQSNTALIVGDGLLLKVFRKVERGRNPDIAVHEALTRAGSTSIAALRGWVSTAAAPDAGSYDLAMLQDYLRTATDGWEYARASVRDLLIEADLYADEVGGDFAGEAERLGATTAHLHQALARVLPTAEWGPAELVELAQRLRTRLRAAATAAPGLTKHAGALAGVYDAVAELAEPVQVQRVHGDLHLGQALRAVEGWKIIDFEGEPGKLLAERTKLDSPVRDVAGMLRSFDYAANSVVLPESSDNQRAHRVAEWTARNQAAFLAGYSAHAPQAAGHPTLLRAYEMDKAVYEVAYETRNRPDWVDIPMGALDRLVAAR